MGRSQRHRLYERGETSNAEVHAQGVTAPGLLMQVDPSQPNVLMPKEGEIPPPIGEVTIPEGAPGGPLQGSSLTGPIPEEMVPPPDPGPPPDALTIGGLDPVSANIGDPDLTLRVMGHNFTAASVIVFNGGEEATTFVSDTEVTTIVRPSTATVAGQFPVLVRDAGVDSNELSFTFTEVVPGGQSSGRTLPLGPITINRIEDHPDGLAIVLADGEVRVGDTVLIEATGNTSVNGNYEVLAVNGLTIVVDNVIVLDTPIEAKGRLTVNGEA
jgi:hypothetical protein